MDRSNRNQAVWAKIRYCPYWPARIVVNPPPELKVKTPPKKLCVFFFGSHNFGFASMENVMGYLEHKPKFMKKGRGADFEKALEECDNYINDNNALDDANYPVNGQIILRREFDFQIKTETNTDEMYTTEVIDIPVNKNKCEACISHQARIEEMQSEIDKIAIDLLSSKKEGEQMLLESEQKDRKLQKLQSEVSLLNNKVVDLTNINRQLKEEIFESNSKEPLYEVGRIIKHAKEKDEWAFLIRWKGYSSADDSWVKESSLQCPKMLENYKKKNHLR